MTTVTVRPMDTTDADRVLAIYQAGIDSGHATFETRAPTWAGFDADRRPEHRLVAVDTPTDVAATDVAATVIGWVAVSSVSAREVYRGVVEHSVYVDPAAHGRGVGRALLDALIASTEAGGIWTIQSGIFPENTASLALHHAAGFHTVGIRRRIARHGAYGNRWRDVVLLERRSPLIN